MTWSKKKRTGLHWALLSLGAYTFGCAALTDGGSLETPSTGSGGGDAGAAAGGSSGNAQSGSSSSGTQHGGAGGDPAMSSAGQAGEVNGGADAGAGGASGAGGAAAQKPDCETYCTAILENCLPSQVLQYTSKKQCLAMCKQFPVGTLDDTTGNTLGCRLHYANLAAADSNCYAAGPLGVGKCGTNCDGYCSQMTGLCPTEFTTPAACQASCKNLSGASSTSFSAPTYSADCWKSGDTLPARMYEVGLRSTGSGGAANTEACQLAGNPCPAVAGAGGAN